MILVVDQTVTVEPVTVIDIFSVLVTAAIRLADT